MGCVGMTKGPVEACLTLFTQNRGWGVVVTTNVVGFRVGDAQFSVMR